MFQVYNIVIRHLYTLQSDQPGRSSNHLSLYKVTTIVTTIFPVHYISLTYFVTGSLYLLMTEGLS